MPTIYVRDGADETVNSTTIDFQITPSVTWLADGLHYVVVWTSFNGSDQDVRGRVFNADGSAVGDDFAISANVGEEHSPQVAALSDGRFVVVWTDSTAVIPQILGQIFDAAGTPAGPAPFLVSVPALNVSASEPSLAAFATGGGFVVSWTEYDGSGAGDTRVLAQTFDSAGTPPDLTPIAVNVENSLAQEQSGVAVLANGHFVVVWKDGSGQGGTVAPDIRMAIFQADGTPVTVADLLVNLTTTTSTQEFPTVEALAGGGYVVAWTDYSQTGGDPSSSAIRARVFTSAGVAVGSELLVNGTTTGAQFEPRIAPLPLPDGGFVVSWTDASGADTDIRAQRFDAGGQTVGGEFLVASDTSGDQAESALAASPAGSTSGNLVIVSTDYAGHLLGTDGDIEQDAFTLDDAPTALVADGLAATEQVAFSLKGALSVADPDSAVLTVTLSVVYGVIHVEEGTSGATIVSGNDSATVTLSGTLAQLNALLGAGGDSVVDFIANTDTPPADTLLTITADDGALTGSDSTTIAITATNDPAILSADTRNLTETNSAVDISSSGTLTISDVDSPATFVAQPGTVGTYGTFAIDAAGAWTYTASSAHDEFVDGVIYTDTFPVASADGTMTSVTINITGTNDAAAISGTTSGSVTEASGVANAIPGTPQATGNLDADDVDNPDDSWVAASGARTYGSYVLGADGAWTYTLDNDNAAVQALNTASTPLTDTFTAVTVDGTQQVVTITINGANDAAVLSADTRNLAETNSAVDISSSGTLTISDVDSPATFVAQTNTGGTYGTFSVDSAGAWTYTASSAHNEFVDGQVYQDFFPVSSSDGTTTMVMINITGTNDAAVLSADVRNLTETNSAVDISSSGILTITDVDSAATFVAQTNTAGSYGTFSVDAAGAWTYTASSAHDEFVDGQIYTDTFPVASADGTMTSVTINITGTNDAAVITGTTSGSVTEASGVANGTPGTPQATGNLDADDVDNPDDSWTAASGARTYGSYVLGADGAWTYTLDNDNAAVQALNTGGTLIDTFTAVTVDGTQQVVTITINGANDAAVLSSDTRNLTETNSAVDISSSGTLTISDVDSSATFVAQTNTGGTYGTFSIDSAGAWTYTASSAHNEFVDGQLYQDFFSVASADGTTTTVMINITGTNDAAILSADVRNLTETNSAVDISSSGTLTISDVDSPATFVTQTNTAGSYGTFSVDAAGAWTYTASSAHDEFVDGQIYTDTFPVASADGTMTSVTINITGTNDAAILSADVRNLTETNSAVDISSSGTLTISDVDSPATFVAQTNTGGTYGTFSIDSGGAWTYTASSAHNEFVDGQLYQDFFSVSSADGTTTTVMINITGTNDAAILSADTRNLTETNSAVDISSSGTLTISDVDSPQTFVAQTNTAGSYGTFSVDSAGAWTYTASSAHDEFVDGVVYTDTFPVASADGTMTSVTINITGTNDAAVLSSDTRNLTETNSAVDISSSGTLTISDVDSPATFVAQPGTVGTYGTFAIDAAGAWTYTASSAHNEFVDGVVYTDTFPVASADGTMTSVTINITGTNDAAVLSSDTRNLTETNSAVDISSSGTLTISDVDSPATFVAQTNTGGTYGTFSIDSAGAWTYTASSAHNEFVDGQLYQDFFSVSSADGTTTTVMINITGTNDAAVITGTTSGSVTEASGVANGTPGTPQATGNLDADDVDNPDDSWTAASGARTYGSYVLGADGAWTYTLDNDNAAVQALNTGGTLIDTFTAVTVDGTQQVVTITINGANDAAVITGTTTGSVTEASGVANGTPGTPQATGNLDADDVDNPDDSWTAASGAGTYGSYVLGADGAWTYTLDNDNAAVQALNTGGTLIDTFTAVTVDGTQQVVTITINGANDAAVITGTTSGSVTEASGVANGTPGTPQATGNLDADDVDNPDDSWTAASGARTYGSYVLGANGAWTYTLDNDNAAVQALNTGGTLIDTFTAVTVDGTQQVVTITINGANDAAVLSADTRNLTETNSAVDISWSGTLTISDVDSSETFVAQSGTLGSYGTFAIDAAGAWTYTASSAHDEFVGGQTYTDTFQVASADGTMTSVTINILGINDPPSGVAHTLTFVEDIPHVFAAADFTYTDPENNGLFSVTITDLPGPGVGTIYYDADAGGSGSAPVAISAGQTFTLDDLNQGRLTYVPALNANGDNYASFTYQVRDDGGIASGGADYDTSADTITIDLTAVNDEPTVTFAPGGIYTTLEQVALDLKGSILIGDVDSDSVSISVTISAGGYGILTVTPGGSGADVVGSGSGDVTITGTLAQIQALLDGDPTSIVSYTPNTDDPPASTSLGVLVNDNGGSGEGGPLFAIGGQTITITPVNDAPDGIDHHITAVENTPRTLAPNVFTYNDPDGNGLATVTIVDLPTNGTIFYDADGPGGNAPVAVTTSTTFTFAQLSAFRVTYRAAADESGPDYDTFTYVVQDDGGILNGGQDTDPIANTITIDVSGFNNSPQSTGLNNDGVTFFEDTAAGVVFLDDGRDAVITDLDSADFDGGILLVHIVSNLVATEDELVLITDSSVTLVGDVVSVDGVPIGTYSGGGLGEDLEFTLNSGATPASITRLIHNLSYVNTNTVAPNTSLRIVEFRLTDGDGSSMTAFTTISVVSVDDPATAGADMATTDEATPVVIDVVTNDNDIDGPPPSVAMINGTAISVGSPVTLPSGAIVSLNPDGTLSYDPAGAFDATPTAVSGAVNTPAPDSFSYTLAGNGGTANVSMTVTGLDTNDFLLSAVGAGTLTGGVGDDTYVVNHAGDVVVEATGAGRDVVYTSTNHTLAAGSEVEILSALSQSGTGALELIGNALDQEIYGNAGANFLDGGGGADYLAGLGGNDTYVVDAGAVVAEAASEGRDVVYARTNYTLAAGAEVEILSALAQSGTGALQLIGNALAQEIYGNAGANFLDGGGGADYLAGLGGNDTYVVDTATAVSEATGAGRDVVYARSNYVLAAGSEVEILSALSQAEASALQLTGNALAQEIYGNAGANFLDGGGGADYLSGAAGDDVYVVDTGTAVAEATSQGRDIVYARTNHVLSAGAEIEILTAISQAATTALQLTGNAFGQEIYGNAGANFLDGGGGADLLVGLAGNDIYIVDSLDDVALESLSGGTDVVYARSDYTLAAGSEIEVLSAISQSATTAMQLIGNALAQEIYGNAGANFLDGGGGADYLAGLGGDDSYVIDNGADVVAEAIGGGRDIVYARANYVLAAGAEIEILSAFSTSGTGPLQLTGNEFANEIYGNIAANRLDGGAGADYLMGFAGADTFAFTTALGNGNVDFLGDFAGVSSDGEDVIALDHNIFTGLALGALNPNAFVSGSTAQDADDRIIYDSATGNLYFDADGNGLGAAVLFARVEANSSLTAGDFTVI